MLLDNERQTLRSIASSLFDIHNAARDILVKCSAGTTPETRGAFAGSLKAMAEAAEALVLVHGMLAGAGTEVNPPTWNPTRGQWVAYAWQRLDRALSQLSIARTDLAAWADLQTMVDIVLQTLTAVDRTLLYADPLPKVLIGDTVIKVIGPHGDYSSAITHWNFGAQNAVNAARTAIEAYAQGLEPTFEWMFLARTAFQHVFAMTSAAAVVEGITFTKEEMMQDMFWRVLAVLHDLNKLGPSEDHGMAYFLRELVEVACNLILQNLDKPTIIRPLVEALRMNGRLWGWKDGGTWATLVFADCKQVRGCGGRGTT